MAVMDFALTFLTDDCSFTNQASKFCPKLMYMFDNMYIVNNELLLGM